ncbi:1-acyl-sn-glycerol-3-phosphate acyltransferase [Salsuginibacillus halophilus]|uniref:1-acyl-sn-glycerol-3-phosphate acyltransferase n=1 Tax=Salsuginibacillus halophilus TaxID=517424 RepID=A0A2P8HAR2_9BACI|nr:lysophospholipid acyltransferase family protein [Salsuginibacillus halophilus]PSL43269.1 1-acyl-sn-glycerol-3-phosphate acyltransferase [Salsuginibacillus halophilus]
MITENRKPYFAKGFSRYIRYLMKKHFYEVHIHEQQPLHELTKPCVVLVNHSSWWDGLAAIYLNETKLRHNSVVMMDEEGVTSFPFFRWIGAFSVDRNSPKDVGRSLRYARKKLAAGETLWLFPQGRERHQELRPLDFQAGLPHMVRDASGDTPVVFITFYYTFRREQKPELFIETGTVDRLKNFQQLDFNEQLQAFEAQLTTQLNRLRDDVQTEQIERFSPLFKGRRTASEWFKLLTPGKKAGQR